MDLLVSTQWLADEMGATDLRIVDATYFLPESGRDAAAEYEAGHIPGALYMNLDELSDTGSGLPNMVPPPEKFASRMQALGLGDGSRIVVYDNSPWRTAARGWWMLKMVFGAHDVAILDGGLEKWKAEGRALETGKPAVRHRHFTVWQDEGAVATKADVASAVSSKGAQIVDARGVSRFTGEEPEQRPGLSSGHIPGSRNLPYARLFNADATWKRGNELKGVYQEAGVDLAKPLIATCGSGVTAANVLFGAMLLGKSDVSLYDGSWAEWGSDPETPKATGAA